MRVLGTSSLGKRAQSVVRDDPRFENTLAVEKAEALYLYMPICLESDLEWSASYTEWAKLTPVPPSATDAPRSLHTIKPSNDVDASQAILAEHKGNAAPSSYGNAGVYQLSHLALSGRWQDLDIMASLEGCICAIMNNQYHLFFV